MKKEELVYLALGSNLGDRNANLKQATLNLKKGLTILRVSHVYETPPWGVTDQPAFYNQVVEVKTSLSPQELLKLIKQIETEMGQAYG